MKSFIEYVNSVQQKQPTWVFPNIQKELDEIFRTADTFNINRKLLLQATKNAKLVTLDDNIWSKLKNTDSKEIQPGDVQTVYSLAKQYDRDADKIFKGLQEGQELPAPIILIINNEPYLVAGNTRLMAAKATGIRPKVLMINL